MGVTTAPSRAPTKGVSSHGTRVSSRLNRVRTMIRPTAKAMRWPPIVSACAASFAALQIARPKFAVEPLMPEMIPPMRIAMLMLALGVPFALDDPAAETLASKPTRLWVGRALRIALVLPLFVAAWLLLLRFGNWALTHTPTWSGGEANASAAVPPPGPSLPAWGLSREFATYVVAGLAFSALGARALPERIGSIASGPALLAVVGAATQLPRRLTLFPEDPRLRDWAHAHNRWMIALVVASVLLVQLCRDPGRPRLRARIKAFLRRGAGARGGNPRPP